MNFRREGSIMKEQILENNMLLTNQNPQLNIKKDSNTIKHKSFSSLSTKISIWIPETSKSIFVTAIEASAPLPISIILSNGEEDFLSLRITKDISNVGQRFFSPLKLTPNNTLMIGTSDEDIFCNTFVSVSADQVDYNGRSDFTNVNNAIGLVNGNVASLASGLLMQSRGRIILGYNISTSNHDYLEIEKVIIKYYCYLSLTVAIGVSSMILYWRSNPQANWIELQEISLSLIGTINHLTTPIVHDITDTVLEAPNPWELINNIQTSFVGIHTGLGLGNTIQLDAVEIEVCMKGINQITVFGYEA